MFDIGFWEISLIGVIALLVIGPERLPGVARNVGFWIGRMRRYVGQVRSDIEREVRADELKKIMNDSAGIDDLRDVVEETRKVVKDAGNQIGSAEKAWSEDVTAPAATPTITDAGGVDGGSPVGPTPELGRDGPADPAEPQSGRGDPIGSAEKAWSEDVTAPAATPTITGAGGVDGGSPVGPTPGPGRDGPAGPAEPQSGRGDPIGSAEKARSEDVTAPAATPTITGAGGVDGGSPVGPTPGPGRDGPAGPREPQTVRDGGGSTVTLADDGESDGRNARKP